MMSAEWVLPGRLLVHPSARPGDLAPLLDEAEVVQFREPLPSALCGALAQVLRLRPDVELYVYGHYGQRLDGALEFLKGFEFIERLSLNVGGLQGLDGLERFTSLRSLTLQGMIKRNVSVAAIAGASQLEHLHVDQPVRDLTAIAQLPALAQLGTPATKAALASLAGHPSLRRLKLNFGTCRDLSALETCPQLRDVELWQIKSMEAADLRPIARILDLEALALGALRNVVSMSWLDEGAHRLRFLSLEKLPQLDTYEPLAGCTQLVAFGAWESRPADRSLRPLHRLPLADVVLGDVYPTGEIEALFGLVSGRARVRSSVRGDEPALRWRCLFEYADAYRRRLGD
jgi:hypothetical protein